MYTGPNLAKDNLVFGYDSGYGVADNETTTRFYPGESTANLFTYPYLSNHTDSTNSTTSIVKEDFGGGLKGVRFIQASTSPILSFTPSISTSTPVSGGTYTWSSYVDSTSTGSKLKSQVTVYVNGVKHWLTASNTWVTSTVECNHLFKATVAGEWHRVDNQITMPTGTLTSFSVGGFYRATSNFTIKVANLQFEQKGHVTPFTATSRSSTESLIDLKRTTNIDVSNVTFDSTGQPTFDGTDDSISLTDNFDLNDHFVTGQDFSIEAVTYMRESPSQNGGVLCNQKYSSETDPAGFGLVIKNNNTYALNLTNNTPTSYENIAGIPFNVDNYHHIVYTFNSSTGSIVSYSNGSQYGSATNSSYSWRIPTDSTRTYVGYNTQGGWGNYINMDVPVIKVYSKALTAGEVKQNYNAYKHRFNI